MSAMELSQFLKTGIRISSALGQVHKRGVVHRNIRPRNIIIPPDGAEVELQGGISDATAPLLGLSAVGSSLSPEALPYISPEQTERVNRPVDHRSDLYSLGVSLYEMLTGALPFQADDALGWVHCHIAKTPRPAVEVAPSVPAIVSDILMKLLAKVAEERYQSARGLEHDLGRCLAQLQAVGRVEPFPLGMGDVPDKPEVPAKLYGRDAEVAALLEAFETSLETGAAALTLVSGYSGVGKSSLVNEVQKPILRERGFYISGKFEQFKRDIPYLTISSAFRDLIRQILGESEARLDELRGRLRAALGPNGQIVADVIPQIELIIGKQPPVPALVGAEAQTRFMTVFRDFIGVFATRKHPLAVFLDDLQWADFGSLRLLLHVITHPETKHVFIIGAYRDNEVTSSHPLMMMLDEVRKAGVPVTDIVLSPLAQEHLTELCADTFRCDAERAAPLAELLREKTGGNPFFVSHFLSELSKERLVRFDEAKSGWQWDIDEIRSKNFTDNVVELMLGKLRRLSGETQTVLMLAACIGSTPDLPTLSSISDRSEEQIVKDLAPAVLEGLVLRRGDAYKFLHDRVQQAAYALIPEGQQGREHLKIARLLRERTPDAEVSDKLFDIVYQCNLGAPLITSREEKREVAELNLRAGRKAKASSAYRSAAGYLSAGIALLSEDSWGTDYDLAYGLHLELAECEQMNGSFSEAERLAATILAHGKSKLDRAHAYRVQIELRLAQAQNRESIDVAIECLKSFGIELSFLEAKESARAELGRIREGLKERRIEDLLDLPLMTDPEMTEALSVLAAVYPSSMYTDPNFTDLVIYTMVSLSMRFGNAAPSSLGYSTFGMMLCAKFGDYDEGYRFGKLAYDLAEKHNFAVFKPGVSNVFAAAISIWKRHFREYLRCSQSGLQSALEAGSTLYSCSHHLHIVMAMLVMGEPLDKVYKASLPAVDFMTNAKLVFTVDALTGAQRFAQAMRGLTDSLSTFTGEGFDEGAFEAHLHDVMIPMVRCWYQVWKAAARYMSGDYADAAASADVARSFLVDSDSTVMVGEYYFYSALIAAAQIDNGLEDKRAEFHEKLLLHRDKLGKWAESCPENFRGKFALVAAEAARIDGKDYEAIVRYDEAVRAFRASGFVQHEGLSNELAARFYQARGFANIPNGCMREARSCYLRWGADGKARQLDRLYPKLLQQESQAPPREHEADAEKLDSIAAVRASQALSTEIAPEVLLTTLMRTVIEHAGAQRCSLLSPKGEELVITAEAKVNNQRIDVKIHPSGQAPFASALPISLITFVKRSREKVLLDNAAAQSMFPADEYLLRRQPKSLFCVPIVRRGALAGVLYLENNLVSGAFSGRRLALLEFLAAISLDNTTLHAELAQENAGRRQVEETLRQSEERLRGLLETANVVPWEADGDTLKFTYVGPQVVGLFGYPQSQWYTDDFLRAHIHPDDREQALAWLRGVTDKKHGDFEFRMLTIGGRPLWLHSVLSATARPGGGKALGGFLFNVTERKEVEATLREKLEIIEQQQDAIQTLSTPIIEVWEGVLTMPVLGAVDSHRAQRMMEVLLNAVTRTHCRYTIIDLTGVASVDGGTADYIVKLVHSVTLLGAQGIVVGIRPEVAQTMTSIGVDLRSILTLSNLREALLLCMRARRRSDGA